MTAAPLVTATLLVTAALLVAATLAGCASGGGDPRPPPPPHPALHAPAARLDLSRIERAIRLYSEDRAGRLPAGLDALAAERPPAGGPAYLPSVPLDPWGRPYSYAVTSSRHGTFDLRSYGADTLPGTADDVVGTSVPVTTR